MNDIVRKLTSRKLWVAVAGVATGIALAFGADAGEITKITGSITALISAITYIITEGRVDAAREANTLTLEGLEVLPGGADQD